MPKRNHVNISMVPFLLENIILIKSFVWRYKMSKLKWKIIHESDDEDGNPTQWSTEINHGKAVDG